MINDISNFLTFEIKKELADRYFGFRKLIEEDKEALTQKIKHHAVTIEQKICLDLVRIYIMLKSEELIREFLIVTGLEEEIFFDPYLLQSPTIRQRVFHEIKLKGLTRSGRFKKLFLDCYELLERDVEVYRQKFSELLEEAGVINEEIKLFYQKNDLSSILGFLRSLEAPSFISADVVPQEGYENDARLENKMRVTPPAPVESLLTFIPPIVPLPRIRDQLKLLAERAYLLHGRTFLESLAG